MKYKLLVPLGIHKVGEVLEATRDGELRYSTVKEPSYMWSIRPHDILIMVKLDMLEECGEEKCHCDCHREDVPCAHTPGVKCQCEKQDKGCIMNDDDGYTYTYHNYRDNKCIRCGKELDKLQKDKKKEASSIHLIDIECPYCMGTIRQKITTQVNT